MAFQAMTLCVRGRGHYVEKNHGQDGLGISRNVQGPALVMNIAGITGYAPALRDGSRRI